LMEAVGVRAACLIWRVLPPLEAVAAIAVAVWIVREARLTALTAGLGFALER
jgi:hypothetical protein